MQNDVLAALIIFQTVFFFLDVYIFSKTTRDIVRKTEFTYFAALIVDHLVYLVMNSLWTLQEYGAIHFSRSLMTAVCTMSLACVSLCPFIFFIFTVVKNDFHPAGKRIVRFVCAVPAAVVLAMVISSPWIGWIFSLNAENRLVHGPMYMFMVVASSMYLIGVIGIAWYSMATAKTLVKRKASGALLLSVVTLIAFVIIDDQLNQATVLPAAVFAVILVIFFNLLESNINNDALTGMNNRRKADDYLMNQLADVSEGNPLYLYMCDLNSFKSINDIYGHTEGDEALRVCSRVLKQTIARYNGFAARFGGDEFMMCWRPGREADPEQMVSDVHQTMKDYTAELNKPYSLTISIGYAICGNRKEPPSSCIKRADEMLYRRKAEFYRQGKKEEPRHG